MKSTSASQFDPVESLRLMANWVSRRLEESRRGVLVWTQAAEQAMLTNASQTKRDKIKASVEASWQVIQDQWEKADARDWASDAAKAATYRELMLATAAWVDTHFPVNKGASGQERKRLMAAVRQARHKERDRKLGIKPYVSVPTKAIITSLTMYTPAQVTQAMQEVLVQEAASAEFLIKVTQRLQMGDY